MKNKKRVRKVKDTKRKKKARIINTQQNGVIEENISDNDECIISSDDADYIDEELKTGRIGFLSSINMDNSLKTKGKKKKYIHEEDEQEEGFESVPRQPSWNQSNDENLHYLLPLKHKTGLIHQDPVKLTVIADDISELNEDNDQSAVHKGSDDESEGSNDETQLSDYSAAQIMLIREKKLVSKKSKIADLSSRIIENPQTNISLLGKLRRICTETSPEIAVTIRKLAMVSLLMIYKDIIPGYSIRELSEAEKSVKVSKDVRQLRDYEQCLITNYKQYIVLLRETTQEDFRKQRMDPSELNSSLTQSVALQCLCGLATSLAHFNFRTDIFSVIIHWMASPFINVSQLCCNTISTIFNNDPIGDTSLEIVQLMTKMIKGRGYNVPIEVIRTYLSLQLQSVEGPVNQLGGVSASLVNNKEEKLKRRMEEKRMSRKQKRKCSLRNRVERQLKETEIEESQEKKSKLQTDCIKMVFFVYFRILKYNPDSHLLSDVLEGLAKFSHLISIDYFTDLMIVLQEIMNKKSLSPRNTLRCVLTCFEILSGQGEALNVDPRTFYCQLYAIMLHLDYNSAHQDVVLLLQCLERMVKKRRQVSIQRICSYIKRLSSITCQLSSGVALAVMATIRLFMQSYPHQANLLLEYNDTPCSIYQPDITDPELSGAQSTLLWELSTITKHFDPCVASYAQHLIKGAPSQGQGSLSATFSRRTPLELIDDYSWTDIDPLSSIATKPVRKVKQCYSVGVNCTTANYMTIMIEKADRQINKVLETDT